MRACKGYGLYSFSCFFSIMQNIHNVNYIKLRVFSKERKESEYKHIRQVFTSNYDD